MPAPAATALDSGSQMSLSRAATTRVSGQRARSPGTAPAGASRRRSALARRSCRQSYCASCLGAQIAVRRRGRQQGTDNGEAHPPACVWQPPPVWSGTPSSIGRDGKFCYLTIAELARQRR